MWSFRLTALASASRRKGRILVKGLTTRVKRRISLVLCLAVLLGMLIPTKLTGSDVISTSRGSVSTFSESRSGERSYKPDQVTQARVSETYGKLPLSFEVNQGQTDEQVKFLSRGHGYSLFLTPTEAVLALGGRGDRETRRRGEVERGAWKNHLQPATSD